MIVGKSKDPGSNRDSGGQVTINHLKYQGIVIAARTSDRSCLKADRAEIPWSCCLDLFQITEITHKGLFVCFRVNLDLNMVLLTGKVTQMLTMPEPHPATYLMRRNNHGAEKKLKVLAWNFSLVLHTRRVLKKPCQKSIKLTRAIQLEQVQPRLGEAVWGSCTIQDGGTGSVPSWISYDEICINQII